MTNQKKRSNKRQIWQEVWEIFLGTSFCIYTWSIIIVLYDIPSFILRLNITEIIGHTAYQFTFAFIESAICTIILVGISSLIVKFTSYNYRAIIGNLIVFYLAFSVLIYHLLKSIVEWLDSTNLAISPIVLTYIPLGLLLYLLILAPFMVKKTANNISVINLIENAINRLSPLISIYLLFSFISLIVVIGRNVP